jgi:hypothetical protein
MRFYGSRTCCAGSCSLQEPNSAYISVRPCALRPKTILTSPPNRLNVTVSANPAGGKSLDRGLNLSTVAATQVWWIDRASVLRLEGSRNSMCSSPQCFCSTATRPFRTCIELFFRQTSMSSSPERFHRNKGHWHAAGLTRINRTTMKVLNPARPRVEAIVLSTRGHSGTRALFRGVSVARAQSGGNAR